MLFRRVFWIVLDGVGAGELPDAAAYHDLGSNTLGNLSRVFQNKMNRTLNLPTLASLGLGNITSILGTPSNPKGIGSGAYGKAIEQSQGKDTTSGHWEMAGLVLTQAFTTYPNGFPEPILQRWIQENHLPGVLGNKTASGTTIIEELGLEHLQTGKPIVYTSADSVWQVAAHEQSFGLDRLYAICYSARKICDELQIGRVIARPFVGDPQHGIPFQRTYNRKDYAQKPKTETFLDLLCQAQIPTIGIGKISSIYATQGIQTSLETHGNTDGMRVLLEQVQSCDRGLVFCNLIDFDMLYGHRRDVVGFGKSLEEFDQSLSTLLPQLKPDDLLLISADHGNDPTYPGTDHTREYIPVLAFSPSQSQNHGSIPLGIRSCFGDLGATAIHALTGHAPQHPSLQGTSFLPALNLSL